YMNGGGMYSGGFGGNVYADGSMLVDFDDAYICPLPPGEYIIDTVQPGQMNSYQIAYGMVLMARHRSRNVDVTMRMEYGIIDPLYGVMNGFDGYQYNAGLGARFSVVAINNQPCGYGMYYDVVTPNAAY